MKTTTTCLALCAALSAAGLAAAPRLADPFTDAMVLQRGIKVPVWGTADPGASIKLAFAGQTKETKSDPTGAWRIELDPLTASDQNRTLTVSDGMAETKVSDVLVGEVWICSGQSNMEWSVFNDPELAQQAATANDPALRLRTMQKVPAAAPRTNILGSPWLPCTTENLRTNCDKQPGTPQNRWGFSAVAYVFGKQLRQQLKVPVGLIETAWGGTRIEAWTPQGAAPAVPPATPHPKLGGPHQQPAALYQGMVLPWAGYAIRGAIWYQGESNCIQADGMAYADRLQAMVSGWRAAWKQGDFPFYFVQIAPFTYGGELLPVFWQAQTAAASRIPAAGMATTQDVGNWKDIHPKIKTPVGERLARLALSRTYRIKFRDDCGPIFKATKAKGGRVHVAFDHAASGLDSRDGKPLTGFELAGPDGVFVPAEAKVIRNTLVVTSPQVTKPAQVRFGWVQGQDTNLVNGEKLPAVSFSSKID